MENVKTLSVVITDEQRKQLQGGAIVTALDGKTMLMLVDEQGKKKLVKVTRVNSTKPRFVTFYAPNRSTPVVCVFSENDFKKAIEQYKQDGENMKPINAYKRNGEKDEQGNNVPLEQQIKNGTARVVAFAVTKQANKAFKVGGIPSCYIDEEDNAWFIRDDVMEITDGLQASNWKVDIDTIVSATIQAAIDWQ